MIQTIKEYKKYPVGRRSYRRKRSRLLRIIKYFRSYKKDKVVYIGIYESSMKTFKSLLRDFL